MRRKIFVVIGCCLALLIAALVVHKKGSRSVSQPPAKLPMANVMDMAQVEQRLRQIEPDKVILVEKQWRHLVPSALRAYGFFRYYGGKNPYRIPDRRINPVLADYVLASVNLDSGSMLYGADGAWEVLARAVIEGVILLGRTAPVSDQLKSPLSEREMIGELNRMERVTYTTIDKDEKKRTIRLLMDKFEVTHDMYAFYLNEIRVHYEAVNVLYEIKNPTSKIVYFQDRYQVYKEAGRLPVFNVSNYGARAFCEHYGKRLPSSEEWREAAGISKGYKYPWGNETDFASRANFLGGQDGYPFWAPVDAFPKGKSPFGLYNMSGNIYEWVEHGTVIGGSWEHPPALGDISIADYNDQLARNLHDGFRCAADREWSAGKIVFSDGSEE